MSRVMVVLVVVALVVMTLTVPTYGRRHDDKWHEHEHDRATDSSGVALFGPGQSVRDIYLKHVQCRRCVTPLNATALPRKALKHYPMEPMTWCADDLINDYHGQCAPTAFPPATTTTNSVTSAKINGGCNGVAVTAASMCANDDPSTKPSCTTCVLDGYVWTMSDTARIHKDEYDGACSAVAVGAANEMTHLRECLNLVYNIRGMKAAAHSVSWVVGLVGIVAIVASLCCCLRCCAQIRAARLAKLNAANAAPLPVVHYSAPAPVVGQSPYHYMPAPPMPPAAHAYPAQSSQPQPQPLPQRVYIPQQRTSQPPLLPRPSLYPTMNNQYGYNGIQ